MKNKQTLNAAQVKSYNFEEAAQLINIEGLDHNYLINFLKRKEYLNSDERMVNYDYEEAGIFSHIENNTENIEPDNKNDVRITEEGIIFFRILILLEINENDTNLLLYEKGDKSLIRFRYIK